MGYEILDAGGDAGVRVTAYSLKAAFADAALGMYSLVADLAEVKQVNIFEVEVTSQSLEGLVVAWLNELVFHLDSRGFVASRVEVSLLELEDFKVCAILAGEVLDTDRHGHGPLIKAATYHDLKVQRVEGLWFIEVVFDI